MEVKKRKSTVARSTFVKITAQFSWKTSLFPFFFCALWFLCLFMFDQYCQHSFFSLDNQRNECCSAELFKEFPMFFSLVMNHTFQYTLLGYQQLWWVRSCSSRFSKWWLSAEGLVFLHMVLSTWKVNTIWTLLPLFVRILGSFQDLSCTRPVGSAWRADRVKALITPILCLSPWGSWTECEFLFPSRCRQPEPPHGPQQPLYGSAHDAEPRHLSDGWVPPGQHPDVDRAEGARAGGAASAHCGLPELSFRPPHGWDHWSLCHGLFQRRWGIGNVLCPGLCYVGKMRPSITFPYISLSAIYDCFLFIMTLWSAWKLVGISSGDCFHRGLILFPLMRSKEPFVIGWPWSSWVWSEVLSGRICIKSTIKFRGLATDEDAFS